MNPTDQLTKIQSGLQNLKSKVGQLPEITGQDISQDPSQIDLADTFEEQSLSNSGGTVKNVSNSIVEQQKAFQEAQQAAQEQESTLAALGAPLAGQRQNLEDRFGLPQNMKELQDINLQLSNMQEGSNLNKAQATAGGAGAFQAQRAITLEDKQHAIRSAGLAARAAVLQGNIQTARTLVNDMMSDVYADRSTKLNIASKQLDRAYDVADNKEKQLLDAKRQEIEQEQARIKEVKDAANAAVVSGAATQEEIAAFADSNIPDDQKLALAQQIIARGAGEDRALDRAATQSLINQRNASADASRVKSLIDRAEAGDIEAANELGLSTDPDMRQYQIQTTDIQMGVNAAQRALDQIEGLKLSTGAYQSPFTAAALQSIGGGAAAGAIAGSVVPGAGTLAGGAAGAAAGFAALPFFYSRTKTAKDEFLAAGSFLINDTTFQEIRDLRAQGVTFGNMTEGERIAAGRAAQELNSAAEIDETGAVVGFRGDPESIEGFLNDIKVAYEGRQEYLDTQTFITPEEAKEAKDIWNQE